MRATTFLGLLTATFLLVGCQATSGTRDRAATIPAGPVSTASTSTTEIPAGTTLVIRAGENINCRQRFPQAGQYRAEVAEDVVNANGRVLIPRGSQAQC
jgi:type IV secretory pathway VirB10-like protein